MSFFPFLASRVGTSSSFLGGGTRVCTGLRSGLSVQLAQLSLQGKDLGLFISGGKPFSSFQKGFELVACIVHETVDSEDGSIIIVFLFLFHVATEVDISGREITLEKVSQEIKSGSPKSGELVLRDLTKALSWSMSPSNSSSFLRREERCSRRIRVVA